MNIIIIMQGYMQAKSYEYGYKLLSHIFVLMLHRVPVTWPRPLTLPFKCKGSSGDRTQPQICSYGLNGIQADLALGGSFFHSHPLSTHIWYQNVQLTFRRQFWETFTEQDSKCKHKATKSIHSSSRKERIPHGMAMVFPGMRT